MKEMTEYYSNKEFTEQFGETTDAKLIICRDFRDRYNIYSYIFYTLGYLAEAGDVSFYAARGGAMFKVYIASVDKCLHVDLVTGPDHKFNFENKLKGLGRYSEIIATSQGLDGILKNELLGFVESRLVQESKDSRLFRLLSGKSRKVYQLPYNEGCSWVEYFDFPVSLYNKNMDSYFADTEKPTPEEFIFAITMENISATTEKEKEAIEKAKNKKAKSQSDKSTS